MDINQTNETRKVGDFTIRNVMTYSEAIEKLGLELLSSIEEKKYVFEFLDSAEWQYASADIEEEWSLGTFVEGAQ